MDNMHTWDNDQIRDYYDQNPNLTILTYAGMLGLSGGELKEILMNNTSRIRYLPNKTTLPHPIARKENKWIT